MGSIHNASNTATWKPLQRSNRVAVSDGIAVLFCPAPDGKLFAVTIDRADLDRVLAAGFWRVANFQSTNGKFGLYCYTSLAGRKGLVYLHRFILRAQPGQQVDHRNRRTLDNRQSEIRLVTGSLNQLNKKSYSRPNKHGLRGVHRSRSNRFIAVVTMDRRKRQLGTFDTPELAAQAVRDFLMSVGAVPPAATALQ